MLDTSNLGVVCVKIRKVSELKLIIDNLDDDLVLKTDLLLGEKLLDEGKQLGLIGKEVVDSLVKLEANIKEHHVLNGQGRYEPAIDLSFLNMSNMKDSCNQLRKQMQKQDEEKRKKEQEELQAKLDEEDLRENELLLQEAGDLSYKVPARDWVAPETQEEFHPKPLPSDEALKLKKTERRITRYMTAEPDDKGIVKVYIDDPDVANAAKENISVSFSMKTYTVRVKSTPPLLLGPVECDVIDPDRSTWRLSQGKRLTLSLMLSEAGKINHQNQKRWDALQAKMKEEKEKGLSDSPPKPSTATSASKIESPPSTTSKFLERYRAYVVAFLVALFSIGYGLLLASR